MPDFSLENFHEGFLFGLDEVGRAPLAGPVVAACVHIPVDKRGEKIWTRVDDSKKLSRKQREGLIEEIKAHSVWAVAEASAREIEEINIVQASFRAMERAFMSCEIDPRRGESTLRVALVDGHIAPRLPCRVQTVIRGDSLSISIAAASILAKVHRDGLMDDLARTHPHYGWNRNAGYPTKEHLSAINKHGLTDHHRRSFAPVRNFLEFGTVEPQLKIAL